MRNPYEDEREEPSPRLPKDPQGRTIVPTIEDLQEQLRKVREVKEAERIAQQKQRLWDQR